MRGVHIWSENLREREIPLGKPRLRWEDKVKMDLQIVGWGK
jgi:hypothetical protein